jgi:DNA-binding GntR family transcriptional regulator
VTGRLEHFGEPGDLRVWVRIANTLLDRIASGEYTGRVPSRGGIAAEFSVSLATAQRILRELAARDVIRSAGKMGHYVRGEEPADPRPPSVRVRQALLDRIASGDLEPWQAVPPIKALRREHGCSRRAVTAALAPLERSGAIRRTPGGGYQVIPEGSGQPQDGIRERLTEALIWAWDGAYKIGSAGGMLEAWRMDGSGTLHADTPEELRDLIRGDYGLRPVALP